MNDYITETMTLEDILAMMDLALEYVSGGDDHIPEMLQEEARVSDEYMAVFEHAVGVLRKVTE